MLDPSHLCMRLPQPRSPDYSYTQDMLIPVSPYSERPEDITCLPTLLYSINRRHVPDQRTETDINLHQTFPSPLSNRSKMKKTLSGGRMVETDFERFNSQSSGSGRTTPDLPFSALPLSLNNTAQMYKLMEFETTPRYCKLTVETIQGLISRDKVISARKKKLERDVLVEYLFYWTSMTLHPFIILICTVQYVELLKFMHPSISFNGKLRDAMLRVMFSAFLIATKMVSDVCYANAAFIRHTPWTLEEINSMEAELLVHIQYRSFISPVCLLRRAKDFWAQPHEDTHSPEDDDDDDVDDETTFGPTMSSYDTSSD